MLAASSSRRHAAKWQMLRRPRSTGLWWDYTIENAFVISIAEQFSFHASIHQQIKDIPDH